MEIEEKVIDVLKRAESDEDSVRLASGSLERPVYEKVAEIMKRVGGVWTTERGKNTDGSPRGYFYFKHYPPAPMIEALVESREMPPKNPTHFFPTPEHLVREMLQYVDMDYYNPDYVFNMLEPSAGVGGICDVVKKYFPKVKIDCVEILPLNAQLLRQKGYKVHEMDFMKFEAKKEYDVILMNPPFDGTVYIDHVMRAYGMLRDFGRMAAIVPSSFIYRTDEKSKEFLKFASCTASYETIEKGAFKESGTMVETAIVYLEKRAKGNLFFDKDRPHHLAHHAMLLLDNNELPIWGNTYPDSVIYKRLAGSTDIDLIFKVVRQTVEEGIRELQRKEGKDHETPFPCLDDKEMAFIFEHYAQDYLYRLEDDRREDDGKEEWEREKKLRTLKLKAVARVRIMQMERGVFGFLGLIHGISKFKQEIGIVDDKMRAFYVPVKVHDEHNSSLHKWFRVLGKEVTIKALPNMYFFVQEAVMYDHSSKGLLNLGILHVVEQKSGMVFFDGIQHKELYMTLSLEGVMEGANRYAEEVREKYGELKAMAMINAALEDAESSMGVKPPLQWKGDKWNRFYNVDPKKLLEEENRRNIEFRTRLLKLKAQSRIRIMKMELEKGVLPKKNT